MRCGFDRTWKNHHVRDRIRLRCRPWNYPTRLAAADQPNTFRINFWAGSQILHASNGVLCELLQVGGTRRFPISALRISHAAFIVVENSKSTADHIMRHYFATEVIACALFRTMQSHKGWHRRVRFRQWNTPHQFDSIGACKGNIFICILNTFCKLPWGRWRCNAIDIVPPHQAAWVALLISDELNSSGKWLTYHTQGTHSKRVIIKWIESTQGTAVKIGHHQSLTEEI